MDMWKTSACLALTAALTVSLAACSANGPDAPSAGPTPSQSVAASPGNDGLQGGGAGGTNDLDNDGWPDSSVHDPDNNGDVTGDGVHGDDDLDGEGSGDGLGGDLIGDAGDIADDVGRAVRGAGQAAENAIRSTERTARGY